MSDYFCYRCGSNLAGGEVDNNRLVSALRSERDALAKQVKELSTDLETVRHCLAGVRNELFAERRENKDLDFKWRMASANVKDLRFALMQAAARPTPHKGRWHQVPHVREGCEGCDLEDALANTRET